MKNYLLITVIEMEIFTEQFGTKKDAQNKMHEEMALAGAVCDFLSTEYEVNDSYGYSEWPAYVMDGNNHNNYSWLIVAL